MSQNQSSVLGRSNTWDNYSNSATVNEISGTLVEDSLFCVCVFFDNHFMVNKYGRSCDRLNQSGMKGRFQRS